MYDFESALKNRAFSMAAHNFEPIPEAPITRERNAPTTKLGAIVQSNGDVLFRVLAPTASSVVIDVSRMAMKQFQFEANYDIEKLLNGGGNGPEKNLMLELDKKDNGIFEGTLKYCSIVAGYRSFHLLIDGVEVVDPYSPVCFGGDKYSNFIEVPDPTFEEIMINDVPHGSVTVDVYWSSVMNNWVRQLVYTPPGYRQSEESYPVVYLHEGRSQLETEWTYCGKVPQIMDNLIAEGRAVPAIIVMNNGMLRTPEDGTEKYDGFLRMISEDTIPYVEANYRVKADKWNRALAGLSMGGMQACQGGLSRPDLYAWLGMFSCSIRLRDISRVFEENHHLDILLDRDRTEKEYKLLYRANGIGERNRDKVILDDDAWISEHGIDQYDNYIREIIDANGGEHEWTTFRRSFCRFMELAFKN